MSQALRVGPDQSGRTVSVLGGLVVPEVGRDAPVLEAKGATISQGNVNAHTHLYSGLAPLGMPDPEPPPGNFLEILERVWWRLDRALDAPSLHASARLYIARALLSGTTCLVDHHESPGLIEGSLDVLADAYEELGMRGLLAYGATERNEGRKEAKRGLEECKRFIRDRAGGPLVGALGLHASFTVSDETLSEAASLATELDARMHVHVAEDQADVVDAQRRGYKGPLERLEALGAIPSGSILAHGIHLEPEAVHRAAQGGAWWVHNPRSNEGNQVGYASSLGACERVALGTDGWPAEMEVEAAALERLGTAAGEEPTQRAERLAQGQRLAAELFDAWPIALAPGSLGDLVVRDDKGVRHVVVHGRVVVRDGLLVGADLADIEVEAAREARGLWRRMAAL